MTGPSGPRGRAAASSAEGEGVRRPPVSGSPRPPRIRRGAVWLLGAALLAHLAAGELPLPVEPAAASTSAVGLVDDRGGAAMFTSTGLRPGHTETACVALAVTGFARSAGEVTLSAQVTEDDLAPYLLLTVERGALGDPASCASFTGVPAWSGTLDRLPRTAAAGIPTGWRPEGPASTTYRVSVTVLDDHRAQGLRAAATFVWALDLDPTPEPVPDPGPAPVVAAPAPAPTPGPQAAPTATPAPTPAPATSSVPTTQPEPLAPSPAPGPTPPVGDPAAGRPGGDAGGDAVGDVVQAPPLQASPSSVAEVVAAVGETAIAVVEDGQFPLALVAVVVGFLFVQGRIDRRDPKLALAPVRQDLNDFQDFPTMPRTAMT